MDERNKVKCVMAVGMSCNHEAEGMIVAASEGAADWLAARATLVVTDDDDDISIYDRRNILQRKPVCPKIVVAEGVVVPKEEGLCMRVSIREPTAAEWERIRNQRAQDVVDMMDSTTWEDLDNAGVRKLMNITDADGWDGDGAIRVGSAQWLILGFICRAAANHPELDDFPPKIRCGSRGCIYVRWSTRTGEVVVDIDHDQDDVFYPRLSLTRYSDYPGFVADMTLYKSVGSCVEAVARANARANVSQERSSGKRAGTVSWEEHERAFAAYKAYMGAAGESELTAKGHSARGGFGWSELVRWLGHEPTTYEPYDY